MITIEDIPNIDINSVVIYKDEKEVTHLSFRKHGDSENKKRTYVVKGEEKEAYITYAKKKYFINNSNMMTI